MAGKDRKKREEVRRVIMARNVAARWLQKKARGEYRLTIYQTADNTRNLPSLLRSYRDGRIKMAGVTGMTDMGMKEGFDTLSVWSSDREGLISLRTWLERRGIETSGIW